MLAALRPLYNYSPYARVEKMQTQHGMRYEPAQLRSYQSVMTVGLLLFVLGLVTFAGCWTFLSWAGLPHLFAFLFPYFNKVISPPFYVLYTLVAMVFVFINFCGGLAASCWAVPVFVELPMLGLSVFQIHLCAKMDPVVKARLSGIYSFCAPAASAPMKEVAGAVAVPDPNAAMTVAISP